MACACGGGTTASGQGIMLTQLAGTSLGASEPYAMCLLPLPPRGFGPQWSLPPSDVLARLCELGRGKGSRRRPAGGRVWGGADERHGFPL